MRRVAQLKTTHVTCPHCGHRPKPSIQRWRDIYRNTVLKHYGYRSGWSYGFDAYGKCRHVILINETPYYTVKCTQHILFFGNSTRAVRRGI